MQNKIKILYYI